MELVGLSSSLRLNNKVRSGNLANTIYPKSIPIIKYGPVMDDLGFTLSERLALRQAWNIVRPFTRRYGQEIFFNYLNDAYLRISKFKHTKGNYLHVLHNHFRGFLCFIGSLIEEQDPVMFQLMLNDNNMTHSRCKVGAAFILELAQAMTDYILKVFEKVSSASLESGFRKIVDKFQGYQENQQQPTGMTYNRALIRDLSKSSNIGVR
ncbi:uncharacterized protein Dana_GF16359 [Drosophila ananassae]|uniref:Globin family profile domain-containing protein n=1 Tax=Drosophila ananassae TaxID=7217 RepID=B3LWC7_DROAN|nr:uncharacterized protein Dana_GF16359 [Drosophila ananassae]